MQAYMWKPIDSLKKERQFQQNLGEPLLEVKVRIKLFVGANFHTNILRWAIGCEDANCKLIIDALEGGGVILDHLKNVSSHAVVMLQLDGQNSIIIVAGANMSCWPEKLSDEDLEIVRNAGIVLLQRKMPDSVNIQVAKGVKQVLVKLGDKGSTLFEEGKEPIRQPIISASKVLDTTGAGDIFTAAFAVALMEGKPKKDCLRFAAAAASLWVQVKGAIPSMPDRQSVLKLLQSV